MSRRPTDTKSRILKTTRTLYSTYGCEGTTLDDIITAAGITKGAFYHYFKSKESLCEAIIEQLVEDYHRLTESIDQQLLPIDRLRWIIHELSSLNASGEWVNCRLIIRLTLDSHESNPKIQHKINDFWQWYTDFFEDLIQKCRDAGQLSTTLDIRSQSRLLMSFMVGANTLERALPTNIAITDLAETIIKAMQS
jgi:TetR/AcrR family transcriptional repressor of nem operon